jgi:lactate dehydrogenase-like 2-hydroxyacid dehydrogenase
MTGTTKSTIIITHALPDDWISSLKNQCIIYSGPPDATEIDPSLYKRLPLISGLISLLTIPITEELLKKTPNLRVVSNMAVGVDNIDIKACTSRGIPVGNTPGVLTESTADLTFALLLSIARNIPQASLDASEGRWNTWLPTGWLGLELSGSTLGIIGMGKIGKAVARRAAGFGMNIVYYDPNQSADINVTKVSMDELLQISDIVTLHAPLTSETRRLINKNNLGMMRSSAILINTARGGLVETNALVFALENNLIAGAALDVTDPEPLPPTHPLFRLPNCLIVPHIGSATQQTRRRMAELACQNLLAGLRGDRLPNCVNPEVYT